MAFNGKIYPIFFNKDEQLIKCNEYKEQSIEEYLQCRNTDLTSVLTETVDSSSNIIIELNNDDPNKYIINKDVNLHKCN